MRYANLFERLVANTVESAERFNGTPCLCWTGPRTRAYGKVNVWLDGRTVTKQVHRVMAELAVGRALHPFLETIQHACDVTLCINWLHFEVATNEENARDMQHKRWGQPRQKFRPLVDPALFDIDPLLLTLPTPRGGACPF